MAIRRRPNQPLLDELTETQRKAIMDGSDALKTLHDYSRKSFDLWMLVAKGVAPLVALAERPGMSRKARQNLLADNGYGSLHSTMVSRLVHMADNEAAIRAWRENLPPKQYDAWQSPTSICNKCPAIKKSTGAAPRGSRASAKPKPNVQAAIDTLAEHLLGLALDERKVVYGQLGLEYKSGAGPARAPDAASMTLEQVCALAVEVINREPLKAVNQTAQKFAKELQAGLVEACKKRTLAGEEPPTRKPKSKRRKPSEPSKPAAFQEAEDTLNKAIFGL
jgi:hypothetical protein